MAPHDEGTCYVPAELRPAIILGHWGRKDAGHVSGTSYTADNYTAEERHPVWHPESHLEKLGNFPCYDPAKDLVIPAMYTPYKYRESPLYAAPDRKRDIFAFFKGDLREADPLGVFYSRGIRQKLASLTKEEKWWERHRIWIGKSTPPGRNATYSELLASSVFCFVLPGTP